MTGKKLMDDTQFYHLVEQFEHINQLYTKGALKHLQWAGEYDRLLESNGITMGQLVIEIQKRRGGKTPTSI